MKIAEVDDDITYVAYDGEHYLQGIIDLIKVDLSEPYSIFTYRYFINNWPDLCFNALMPMPRGDLAAVDLPGAAPDAPKQCVVGTIVCKQDRHRSGALRGYIAMLAVHHSVRKRGMGSKLVKLAVRAMRDSGADEAVLETEVTNIGALRLYEGLGFVRDKRLPRYYLNGNDAFRLKVWFHELGAVTTTGQGAEPDGAAAAADDDDEAAEGEAPPPPPGAIELA